VGRELAVCEEPASESKMEEGRTLLSPTFRKEMENNFEFSAHQCTKAVRRQLEYIFPEIPPDESIYAIPTMQRAKYDLVNIGDEVEKEKDDLLENVCHLNGTLIDLFLV
jgi:hypothetical protein